MAGRLSRPRQLGRDLLVLVGARTPEQIDPLETAKELGIEVAFGNLRGATARIFQIGESARIRVSDEIVTEGRRRVSIMHEIAHKVLGHELPRDGDPESWFRTSCVHRDRRDERDADVLAVEHLTPEAMVKSLCLVKPTSFDVVRPIERTFRASRVMAAMRLVELSLEACALVYSERGRIVWMKPSKSFPTYLGKGTLLAEGTVARGFFDRGQLVDTPRWQTASTWCGARSRVVPTTEILEHAVVVPEPDWGGVLSLLWIPTLMRMVT